MLECVKCRATWPDELEARWGETAETSGYGPEPRCVAIVPSRTGDNQVCRGSLRAMPDPQDREELLLLSPIADQAARGKAEAHNRARLDAIRNGR